MGLAACAPAIWRSGFTLTYPTVAFRYRFDVWPVVITLRLRRQRGLIQRFGPDLLKIPRVLPMSLIIVVFGVIMSAHVAIPHKESYRQFPGRPMKHGIQTGARAPRRTLRRY